MVPLALVHMVGWEAGHDWEAVLGGSVDAQLWSLPDQGL